MKRFACTEWLTVLTDNELNLPHGNQTKL